MIAAMDSDGDAYTHCNKPFFTKKFYSATRCYTPLFAIHGTAALPTRM